MGKRVGLFSICALLLLTGITYGAQMEVYGDFSVKPGRYEYLDTGLVSFWGTPRCLCDVTDLVQECPDKKFYSDSDQGEWCYDYLPNNNSIAYGRIDVSPSLNVTVDGRVDIDNGDVNISKPGYGLILKATNGANCFRLTVDNSGVLHTSIITCP